MSSRLERFSALVARAHDEKNERNLAAIARYRDVAKPGLAKLAELMNRARSDLAA
jgi:hypothetical protein